MIPPKRTSKPAIILGILLIGSTIYTTEYHKPDLFPIGFSGIGNTGYTSGNPDQSPYPNDSTIGTWEKEDSLLQLTHCNFIGCSVDRLDKNIILRYTELKVQNL